MSDGTPENRSEWKKAAKTRNIGPTQPLAAGGAFVSASKFEVEHFLRLRVLYKKRQHPQLLAGSQGFPKERLQSMVKMLGEDKDCLFLKSFLQNKTSLVKGWNVDRVRECGIFANAMELLHLIASRKLRVMKKTDDATDNKIVLSPGKPRNTVDGAHHRSHSDSTTGSPTPVPYPGNTGNKPCGPRQETPEPETRLGRGIQKPSGAYAESSSSDTFDMSALSLQEDPELQREDENFERSDFSPGDEQTVNAALVALMMALSWLLGYASRVHLDRASFTIRQKNSDIDLYKACVDGIILHVKEDKCIGFLEAKRDYRGQNSPVRRQISAQMAAFIYVQDIALGEKVSEKPVETSAKGKGKGARNPRSNKWMVSLDGYWAHINIATYDQTYVDFLAGGQPSTKDAFMEMDEYGPFDLRVWSGSKGLQMFLERVGALMLGVPGS